MAHVSQNFQSLNDVFMCMKVRSMTNFSEVSEFLSHVRNQATPPSPLLLVASVQCRDGRIPPFFGRIFVYRIPYTLNISFIINIFEILYQWSPSQTGSDLWSLTHLIIFLKDKAASHTSQLHVSQHYY